MSVQPAPAPHRQVPQRPVLKPALRRLWRSPDTLQLGLDPGRAVVVSGVGPQARHLLGLLDGSRAGDAVLAAASAGGLAPEETERFLAALADADALDDAAVPGPVVDEGRRQRLEPDRLSLSLRHRGPGAAARALTRRRDATIDVHGLGRVGSAVAALLAAAGVGGVTCLDERGLRAGDVSPAGFRADGAMSRAEAATGLVRDTATAAAPRTDGRTAATLAVVAFEGGMVSPEVVRAVRALPHLRVGVRDTTGLVGPFVLPGAAPCLRCVELGRGERDPQWPVLAAQLVSAPRTAEPCDVALAAATAALACLHVLAWVDSAGAAAPASAGGVLEIDADGTAMRRRSVRPHPACGCGAGGS